MDILMQAGCPTKYAVPAVLDLLRGRLDLLTRHLDGEPGLLQWRFAELDFGSTGARRLTLRGGTLLHVAAEYGNVEAAKLLLDRGADIDARATVDESRVGGQTPIFHAVTQFGDWGFSVAELLVSRGADLSIRARLPGHYERPEEFVECTALGYARLFPGGNDHSSGRAWPMESKSEKLLRERGAAE
jgi:ankyrin repeat protein